MGRRNIAIIAGAGAATVALTLGVALARGDDGAGAETTEVAGLTAYVASNSGSENGDDRGMRGQIRELMSNDEFRADAAALRDQHEAAMDEWWDEYGDDPDTDAAREARKALREEHRQAMNDLLEEYGIDTSAVEEAREKAQAAREKIRELMADDDFRAQMSELRDARQAAMDEWWSEHGDEPRSDEAREAMKTLREDARAGMEQLLDEYGIELPEGFGGKGRGGGLMGSGNFGGGPMNGGHGGGQPPSDDSDAQDQGGATVYSL